MKLGVPLAVRKLEGKYEKENWEYTSQLRSLETEIISEATLKALLDQMGIGHLAGHRVTLGNEGLSSGEKQIISIARASVRDAAFLFLDEPGNNLDKATLDWLCAFLRKSGKSIVFISHDDQLMACADSIVMLPG